MTSRGAARIAVVSPIPDAVAARARDEFGAILSQDRNMTVEEMLACAVAQPIEGILFTSRLILDAKSVALLPRRVKVVATYSVGFDHIDVGACMAAGIVVTNTPDVLTDATADLTLLLLLGAFRRAAEYLDVVRSGWGERFGLNHMLGKQVTGSTLGVVGMGRIGRAVARRARGFQMRVLYHDIEPVSLMQGEEATYFPDLEEMLPRCDVVSIHAPGGAGEPIMNRRAIRLMPRGSVLLNAARGDLVDEEALIEALEERHLYAAGLDVYRGEPYVNERLVGLDNVFLTPHMGSATVETRNAMGFRALDNIAAVLAGRAPLDPVGE